MTHNQESALESVLLSNPELLDPARPGPRLSVGDTLVLSLPEPTVFNESATGILGQIVPLCGSVLLIKSLQHPRP